MTSRSPRASTRPQLSEKATAHIRGLIMSGELRPGTLVRPETIGEDLGISTTPAREALKALRWRASRNWCRGTGSWWRR